MADTAAAMPKEKQQVLAINKITVDPDLQIRTGMDQGVIAEYAKIVSERDMSPVDVFFDGKSVYLLADGLHRRAAYIGAGKTEIPVTIRPGGKTEALKLSIKQNCRHGIRMTSKDKRRAADLAVLDAELAKLTDTELGLLIGISATLVGDARRGEKPKEKQERAASRKAKKSGGGGAALVPVSAHERRKAGDARPTKAMALKQIEQLVNDDICDEQDVIALFESAKGHYVFLPKDGGDLKVTIVGRTGRAQIEDVKMIIKDVSFTDLKLKSEKFVISAEKV